MSNIKRVGTLRISERMYEPEFKEALQLLFSKIIVLRCEHLPIFECFQIDCICDDFREIDLDSYYGCIEYKASFYSEKKEVIFEEIKNFNS